MFLPTTTLLHSHPTPSIGPRYLGRGAVVAPDYRVVPIRIANLRQTLLRPFTLPVPANTMTYQPPPASSARNIEQPT